MSTNLIQTLTAAHLNALEKTLSAVETQVAAVKTLLNLAKPAATKADADDEAPPVAKKKATPKAAKPPVDADDEADEFDGAGEIEEEEEVAPPAKSAITKKTVVKALQDYAAENDRPAAMKVLKKFGVASVHDLDPAKYGKLVSALSV